MKVTRVHGSEVRPNGGVVGNLLLFSSINNSVETYVPNKRAVG